MLPEVNRKIIISSEINNNVAENVISQILEINEHDDILSNYNGYSPQPIQLYINSVGGSVTDGNAIIATMEMSETPIHTIGMGLVASMALAIFVAGDRRIAHRYTRFMYHNLSYGMMGHITDHEDGLVEANILQDMYNDLMFKSTKFTKEQLAEIRAYKKDFFFSGKNAVKLGVADEVILRPEPIEPLTEEEVEKLIREELAKLNLIKEQ